MSIKNTIIVLSVFILGGVSGFILSGRIAHKRMKNIHHELGRKDHWIHRMEISDEQLDEIEPILEKHLPAQKEEMQKFRRRMDSMRTEMFDEIKPHLNEEQLRRLKRRHHRRGFAQDSLKQTEQ